MPVFSKPHVEEEETKPKEEEDAKEVAERRVWLMDLMKQSLGLWPTPEQVLDTLDMDGVVKFIKSGKCKNIVTMAGAGISTSAGIPDFRSPTTGLYDNLQKYNLPHPQAVFDIGYFWKNPEPFFHLAKEMWPGVFKVVYQTIRDIGKLKDWKPGVVTCSLVKSNKGSKSGPNNQSPYKMDKGMGQDVIQEVVINPKTQDYTEEVVPQQYTRHWNREDNGCCWMLQTSQDKCLAMFFLVQPVEDMDSCLVTILVHNVSSVGASQVACLLGSLKDYLSLRKVKCTPLTSIRMPNFNNNCHTNNFADSSSDEERDKQFYDRFSSLNDKQKSLVLQKSESILRLRTNSQGKMTRRSLQQRRSQSDTDIIGIVMGDTDSRSQPLIKPADNAQNSSNLLHSNSYGEARVSQRTSPMDVDSEHSQTESGDQNSQKSGQDDLEQNSEKTGYNNGGIRGHGHGEDEGLLTREDEGLLTREEMDTDTGSVVSSIESETPQDDVFDLSDKQPTTPSDVVKFMTLANQSAADILALAVRVSNIELRKSQSQQTESSGGWAFWGLETDVVIFKKILNRSNSLFSFVGKGLISASPQRVFEAIKNPRTRFTYDESLKKVDVLSSITDKAKIVYFYHELVNMFKKECFDFCVLQNERMDGEKFVIAMQSVDNGLPVPSGTERVQMLPSGWIIEPVTRDNKMYSMATYVMQVPPDDACRANMIAGRRYWRRYSILRGCLDTISSIGCFSAIILDPLKSI